MLSRRDSQRADAPRAQPVEHVEQQRSIAGGHVAYGSLACPACDAPVLLSGPVLPRESLACPVCGHGAAVREFLSLGVPTRPARVVVRVRHGVTRARRSAL